MDSKDESNSEPSAMDDVSTDFLPVWMNDVNILEEVVDNTEEASDAAVLEPAQAPDNLNDTEQDDSEPSDEEPPSKKIKITKVHIGVCSYKQCDSAFERYCLACQGFYCNVHSSVEDHECAHADSLQSSLSSSDLEGYDMETGKFP